MLNSLPFVAIIASLLTLFNVNASIHQFETTRLKSTAGAGVGSVLLNESAILNPAPLAFFDMGAVSVHKDSVESKRTSERGGQSAIGNDAGSSAVLIADSSNRVKGAMAYYNQTEAELERKRFSAGFASNIGKSSALGFQYRHTWDVLAGKKSKFNQMSVGATHVVDSNLSLGAILVDPFKTVSSDTKIVVGGQYVIREILSLIADLGGDYSTDIGDTALYRLAAQIRILSDIYIRAGMFKDKSIGEEGLGWGASWISPRMAFDVALKTRETIIPEKTFLKADEKVQELSFGMSLRF